MQALYFASLIGEGGFFCSDMVYVSNPSIQDFTEWVAAYKQMKETEHKKTLAVAYCNIITTP